MIAYLIAALVVIGLIAGAGYKGYQAGGDRVRAEFAQATIDAQAAAEAARQADQDKARKSAANLQAALAKQKRLNATLGDSLARHIAALPKPAAGCPPFAVPDGLRDTINRSLAGAAEGAASGVVPDAGRASAAANRPDDGRADPPAR